MKKFREIREGVMMPSWLHKLVMAPKMKKMVRAYLNWRRDNPDQGRAGVQQVIKMLGLSPRDGNQLIDKLNDMVKKGEMPKHLALESNQPEWGTPESTKKAKKMTPGEKYDPAAGKHAKGVQIGYSYKHKVVKNPNEPKKHVHVHQLASEGSETWEAGYKRRVVKTSNPEHKDKGYNWRIKGKDRPEISIKLYKSKPSQSEFNKQMKRVAGHEFGG